MATNWVDEILTGATSKGSKTLNLATGNVMSIANSSSESLFTVTSDTTNGGYTSILGIEDQEAVLFLGADNSDDAGDVWEIHSDTSGNFKIGNRTSGTGSPTRSNTFTNVLTIDTSRNITVGVDDTGYDVKFFGATSGQYLLWDESADELVLTGDSKLSFHDAAGGENIVASANGHLEINAGTTLDITAPTVDVNVSSELNIDGNVDLNGTLDVSSTSTLTGLVTASAGVKLGNNIIYASDGGSTITLDTSDNVTIAGDLTVSGGDITVNNMTSSGFIKCVGTEANAAALELWADEGDDNADKWQIESAADNSLYFYNYTSGTWVSKFSVTSAGIATTASHHYMGGVLYIGGSDADGTDRDIVFSHGTLKTIMGIDDSADCFIINTDDAYDATLANNSLTIDASHNVGIGGDLTIHGNKLTFAGGAIIEQETSTSVLSFTTENLYSFTALTGNDLSLTFHADASEDDDDSWAFNFADGGDYTIKSYQGGSYATCLTVGNTGNVTVAGDLTVDGGDITVNNMTTSGFIKCVGTEGNAAALELWADEGDDAADKWQIESAADNKLYFYNYTTGEWISKFNIDSAGVATTTSHHYMGGILYIGGAAADGTDRDIVFNHGTARTIMGIDDSADAFVINADNSGAYDGTLADNSFTIDTSSNVTIAGALTIGGSLTLGNAEIISQPADDQVRFSSNDTTMNLQVSSSAGNADSWISLLEGTTARWYIANDCTGGASDDLLTIGTGNTVGSDVELTVDTSGNLTATGGFTGGVETVAAGDGGGSATALSLNTFTSFVTTATDDTHVSLADGTAGQIKIIVHKTRSNSQDLVITPANFAAGSTLTSNAASRSIMLIFDGTNWQVLGEVTGTAEFVIA